MSGSADPTGHRGPGSRRVVSTILMATVVAVATAGTAVAGHWAANGWWDRHYNYPSRPQGYSAIVSVFGNPCNSNASRQSFYWRAADNGVSYRVVHHRKLGGAPVKGWASDRGGLSTNLDSDVRGHIGNAHWDKYVKSGIWGYMCRYISGTTKWSTHAWGIAVDQNAAYEHNGHCHIHTMNANVIDTFKNHRWYQLRCDPMHFQYATGY
jgi:hypothetical protein